LLFLVGIMLFQDKFTTIQVAGCICIFAGISLIVYGEQSSSEV
jgi:drug/metabolite transporter (DMT)-like permease